METEQNGAAFAGMSRHHRSAVTNRTKLFAIEGMDGRLGPARRFRDILEQIECDVGGIANLSEGQRQLCRRAATLSFTAECMEVDAVAGKAFDIANIRRELCCVCRSKRRQFRQHDACNCAS